MKNFLAVFTGNAAAMDAFRKLPPGSRRSNADGRREGLACVGGEEPGVDRPDGRAAREDQEDQRVRDRGRPQQHGCVYRGAGGVAGGGRENVRRASALHDVPGRRGRGDGGVADSASVRRGIATGAATAELRSPPTRRRPPRGAGLARRQRERSCLQASGNRRGEIQPIDR